MTDSDVSSIKKSQEMSLVTHSKLVKVEKKCKLFLENDRIKFLGVINNLGNLIAGDFQNGFQPVGTSEIRKMMFMQLKLDLNMRKDYDELFGPVSYVISKRRDVEKISIPVGSYMVLLITELNFEIAKIENIISTFKSIIDDFT